MEITRLGLIWRETLMADVGIDGQIEHVSPEGFATGRLVAAQVKSGPSYFHDYGEHWHFYPEKKHRFYWERFPMPVLLFLHEPGGSTYWMDVRHSMRAPESEKLSYIAIPKRQRLGEATREELFSATGIGPDKFLSIQEVLDRMVLTRSAAPSFPVSYLELFAHGLTNICRTLYFSMDVAMNVAKFSLSHRDENFGGGLGPNEHEFLFSYVRFLVSQHLVPIRIGCAIVWDAKQRSVENL